MKTFICGQTGRDKTPGYLSYMTRDWSCFSKRREMGETPYLWRGSHEFGLRYPSRDVKHAAEQMCSSLLGSSTVYQLTLLILVEVILSSLNSYDMLYISILEHDIKIIIQMIYLVFELFFSSWLIFDYSPQISWKLLYHTTHHDICTQQYLVNVYQTELEKISIENIMDL